jgi:hypothetical protein
VEVQVWNCVECILIENNHLSCCTQRQKGGKTQTTSPCWIFWMEGWLWKLAI